jgi:lipoyl(octanoyl) transferase
MAKVHFEDWGNIDYKEAWDKQELYFGESLKIKTDNRANNTTHLPKNTLVFCEHPHVFTLGKSGKKEHLLLDDERLKIVKASFYPINRGGDITYHGPGQIVGYPIFDLEQFFSDIHKYLRTLEEAVILTLKEYGIESGRVEGLTGVWIDGDKPTARKICAMGVRASRWVTMHGFAFNVNSNLNYFTYIVPCGIDDKAVTSMDHELQRTVDMEEVKAKLKVHIQALFGFEWV